MRGFGMAVAALCTLLLSGCGYNQLQSRDEQVKAAWSEVLNQYQRRADLVPNLVNTVKGFAQQYGRFETRAKFPYGPGSHSAVWMLPVSGSWPSSCRMT